MTKQRALALAGVCLGLAIGSLTVAPRTADAVPAFARANKVPCTTCHVQFPKLNAFGMKFKQNGYRMEGQKGKFVWTKDNLPLAGQAVLSFENVDASDGQTKTVDRRTLEFFSAGSLGPSISYFLDYALSQDTLTTDGADTVEVSQATPGGTFLILNDLMPDNRLNLRAGVMSNEFLYLATARRTTLGDYLAPVSVDHTGIELNGVVKPAGFRYAAGFGNDEMVGIDGVSNNLRGGYGWGTYTIAGQSVGARVTAARAGAATTSDETHTQLDLNLDLHRGPANLILSWYTQDNVAGVGNDKQENVLAELVFEATPTLLVTGRYEAQDTESGGASVAGTDDMYVLNTSFYLLPNVNLLAEFSRSDLGESGTDEDKFILGFKVGI